MSRALPFRLGYNTNGFAFHRLEEAALILHELGYEAIALTLDVHHLDPFHATDSDLAALARRLTELRLEVVVETGARFLLDPRRKHRPTLVSPTAAERDRRAEFLSRAIQCAARLGASVVSLWSGALDDAIPRAQVWERLARALAPLLDEARRHGVVLALEPEPGMAVETLADYRELKQLIGREDLRLTIDVGHLQVSEQPPLPPLLRAAAADLVNVHLDDARTGVHEHLFFGEGELPMRSILETLRELPFTGVAAVELSRHAHDAIETARRAKTCLDSMLRSPS